MAVLRWSLSVCGGCVEMVVGCVRWLLSVCGGCGEVVVGGGWLRCVGALYCGFVV